MLEKRKIGHVTKLDCWLYFRIQVSTLLSVFSCTVQITLLFYVLYLPKMIVRLIMQRGSFVLDWPLFWLSDLDLVSSLKCFTQLTQNPNWSRMISYWWSLFLTSTINYIGVRIMLLVFFEDISFSRTNSNGTYRVNL